MRRAVSLPTHPDPNQPTHVDPHVRFVIPRRALAACNRVGG